MADTTDLPALCSIDEFLKHDYDFIVVGGGTAGLVVAARLTENANIKVGVLEAGAANIGDQMIMMPAMFRKAIGDPKYDWLHKSVPQKSAGNIAIDQPRGKGLGGSSAINYQMYVRGQNLDFDDWKTLGNKGWGFKDLLPYFTKHEHFDDPSGYTTKPNIPLETTYDAGLHGTNGPIHTSFSTWRLPLEKEWIAASSTLGERMGSPLEAWNGDHMGTHHSLSTIDRSNGEMTGTRSYATTGYLLPNAQRPNLRVLTDALATKLVVSEAGEVTGVEFIYAEKSHTVLVKKEVVLSAGTMKSPQLLELSGIGNPAILSDAGIKCVVENVRVGENFQDHPVTGLAYELADGEKSLDMLQNESELNAAVASYAADRSGPLSSGGSAVCFASYADLATPSENEALQELILSDKYPGHDEATRKLIAESLADHNYGSLQIVLLGASLNFSETAHQTSLLQPPAEQLGKHGITIAACLARPLSTGTIHIASSDPRIDPLIDPGYFTHPADIEVLGKGLGLIEKMTTTSPFKEKIKRRYHPLEIDFGDKKSVEEYLRKTCTTQSHPIGTLAMGKKGVGAVDDRLKVWGAKGVRVVDASVMPVQISGNIVSSVYAIAEKASDLIKEDWKL
ncbi:hypothetical protein V492_07762 [Pseudogymnoascus sp. VKM F-4246]|nr:hypothetical protein V492_07762 [Pseudogymnoascus sp. VKM F-4246]